MNCRTMPWQSSPMLISLKRTSSMASFISVRPWASQRSRRTKSATQLHQGLLANTSSLATCASSRCAHEIGGRLYDFHVVASDLSCQQPVRFATYLLCLEG